MITTLVSVPLAVHYLGVERYGLLLTITSLIALLGFADLGLGNEMLNAFAAAHAVDDRATARTLVSTSIVVVTVVAAVIAVLGALLSLWVSWSDVLNVSSPTATAEAGPALLVFMACFLVNLPLGLVERVELGLQEGFVYNGWLAAASLLGLVWLLLAIELRLGLPWLVLALAGPPIVASIGNSVWLFALRRPWLRPSVSAVSRRAVVSIFRTGMMFFALQVCFALAYMSDNIVIARVLGADAVPDFAIPFKMFNLVAVGLAILVGPLWPAYAEAFAVGDVAWARTALKRSLTTVLAIAVPACVILALAGDSLLELWVGDSVRASTSLLVGLAVWTVLGAAGTSAAMFLNAAGELKIQMVLAVLMTIVNLPLSIVLVNRIGVAGAIWGTVISYSLFVAIPLLLILPRVIEKVGDRNADTDLAVQGADQVRLYFDERLR